MAYFSAFSQVDNYFSVGDIDIILEEPDFFNPNKMSALELDEKKSQLRDKFREDGIPEDQINQKVEEAITQAKENSRLTPGKNVYKNPTVTLLEDSQPAYIFIAVDDHISNVFYDIETDSNWNLVETLNPTTYRKVTIYKYNTVVTAEGNTTLEPLFTQLKVWYK